MPHPLKSVANTIINRAAQDGERLSHLKLQKLMYYVCGYYLAAKNEPAIDHTFEAWEYGPVIPALYHEFKTYGNRPITGLAMEDDWDTGASVPVPPVSGDRLLENVVDFVWKTYGKYSAVTLSEMTHAKDSPWQKTRDANKGIKDADISVETLKEHFSKFIKRPAQNAA